MPHDGARLCFGHVRHRRLRPAVNAFCYRTYFVRLPMRRWQGSPLLPRNRAGLLSFHDADHGDGTGDPVRWIDDLLRAEGIADADGELWLQTMPRVLGYVFNPVSFWFCHRADGALRAIVCDVHNTFGERHLYLLDGQARQAAKVFHVSPFCEVEGEYRFRFLHSGERNVARIDYHDRDGVLIETAIAGNCVPITRGSVLRAFFLYPLMTFGVVARIHWQALRLWVKRVPFFSKPSPPALPLTR